MAKRTVTAVLVLAALLSIGQIAAAQAGRVDLTFWTFIELHQKFYEAMAKQFAVANPNVNVTFKASTIPMNQMHDQLLMSLAASTGAPDIVDVQIRWAGMFFKGNPQYFVDLTPTVDKYRNVLQPEIMKQFTDARGRVLGIPTHIGVGVMYYNKPEFDRAGVNVDQIKTYDEWVRVGQKMNRPNEGVWFTAHHYAFAREFLLYTMQKGGYAIDPAGKITVDGAPAVEALRFIYDNINTQKIATIAPNGSIYDPAFFELMNKGKVLSLPHAHWYTSRFKAFMPDLKGKIVVRPLPLWQPNGNKSASMGGTGTAITRQSKNPDTAIKFLEFAKLSYEGNIKIATDLSFDPMRMDVYSDPRIVAPDPYFNNEAPLAVVKAALDRTIVKPVWEKLTDIQTELSRDVLPAVYGSKKDAAQALKELAAKYR